MVSLLDILSFSFQDRLVAILYRELARVADTYVCAYSNAELPKPLAPYLAYETEVAD